MKELKEMPTEGQFVAVYEYNGDIWSGAYQWDEDGCVTEYCLYDDEFVPVGGMGDISSLPWFCNRNIETVFYVADQ